MRPLHRIALIGAVCAVLAAVGVGAWAFGRDAAAPRPPGEVVVGESPSAGTSGSGPDGAGGDNGVVDPPPAVTGSAEPTPSPSSAPPPDPGTGGAPGGAPGAGDDDDDDDDDLDDVD